MEENRKIRILFVDDEPDILRGVRRMLRAMREEWDVDFVTSAAKALEKMAEAQLMFLSLICECRKWMARSFWKR